MKKKTILPMLICILMLGSFISITILVSGSTPPGSDSNPDNDDLQDPTIGDGMYETTVDNGDGAMGTVSAYHTEGGNKVEFQDSNSESPLTVDQSKEGGATLKNGSSHEMKVNETNIMPKDLTGTSMYPNSSIQMDKESNHINVKNEDMGGFIEYAEMSEMYTTILSVHDPESPFGQVDLPVDTTPGLCIILGSEGSINIYNNSEGAGIPFVSVTPTSIQTLDGTYGLGSDLTLDLSAGIFTADLNYYAGTGGLLLNVNMSVDSFFDIFVDLNTVSIEYNTPTFGGLSVTIDGYGFYDSQTVFISLWGWTLTIYGFWFDLIFVWVYIPWDIKIEYYMYEIVICWYWFVIHWVWIDVYIHMFIEIAWFYWIFKFQWWININLLVIMPIIFWIFHVTNITPIQVILIQTSVVYPRYGINLNIREVEWDNGSLNVTFYVFDEYGQPVDNAMVKMLYDDIERSGTTDVGGLVELKWINTSIESGMMKGNATKAWLQEDYWVDLTLKKCTPCEICNDNGDESNGDSDGDAGNGGIPGFPIGITFVVFCFAIFGLIMTKRKRAFKKPEELFV